MHHDQPGLAGLAARTIVVHTITYFLMGVLAYFFLDYAERFARPELACWMKPIDDPLVMAGPLFQPIRGLIFALVFFPLRDVLFGGRHGWAVMWWMLVALGVLSTFGPPPGSVEGLIYTQVPISDQIVGYLEVVPQALLLSVVLCYWVAHPEKRWINVVLGTIFILIMAMALLGLLVGAPPSS
jgi:hypothetical protein